MSKGPWKNKPGRGRKRIHPLKPTEDPSKKFRDDTTEAHPLFSGDISQYNEDAAWRRIAGIRKAPLNS